MRWAGVLGLLGWAVSVLGQGSAGGDQTASCPNSPWAYVGCYDDTQNGGKANFPFKLDTVAGVAKSYPGYTSSAQLTIEVCQTACRGHGFRYSGLYNGQECYCSPTVPYPQPPTSGTTTTGLGTYLGSNPGGTVDGSYCNTACPANSAETCGGPGYLQVYRDPSYQNETSPATLGAPQNYLYFGCYTSSGGVGSPIFLDIKTPSTISCENYCALLGYPYSIRNSFDSSTSNNCGCGPELVAGLQAASETTCNRYCNGTTGAAGGAGTCGGNNAYSVYQNTNFLGCYVVRQPGTDASHTYAAPANARVACTNPRLKLLHYYYIHDCFDIYHDSTNHYPVYRDDQLHYHVCGTHDNHDDSAYNHYDDLAFNDDSAHDDYDDLTFNDDAAYDDYNHSTYDDYNHSAYNDYDDLNFTHNNDYYVE
ncbi:MAG: hypothetical protein Q9222_004757 [Ikaeria aurantiellina]